MLAKLLQTTPLKNLFGQPLSIVDDNTKNWIFDTFAWALDNFDFEEFINNSQLILPNNEFFQGKVSSVDEMANSMFKQTLSYAGMQQWPIQLVAPQDFIKFEVPTFNLTGKCRGDELLFPEHVFNDNQAPTNLKKITVSYQPSQINKPQDFIATIAQLLATTLIYQQKILPPGGKNFLPQATDLVACFMGFGVIFANSAYQFKGGCGSCYNPKANRQAALSENDTVYALALFCLLKSKSPKSVKPHLKSHLRKTFTHAYRELLSISKTSQNPLFLTLQK
jgi:hypothetical protein